MTVLLLVLSVADARPALGQEFVAEPYPELVGDAGVVVHDRKVPVTPALEDPRLYQWCGFRLGGDMDSLLQAYGGKAVRRADGWRSVCYAVPSGTARRYVIVRESLGVLTEIVAVDQRDRIVPDLPCTPVATPCAGPENPAGLRLGMTGEEIAQVLGPPWVEQEGRLTYASARELGLTSRELQDLRVTWPDAPDNATIDSLSTVIVRMKNGRAAVISVSRVETY